MKRVLSFAALGILIVVLLVGCMFGKTLEQRIQQFADDLNLADRSDIYLNFHPTQTTDYAAIHDPAFFNSDFPLTDPGDPTDQYVIAIVDASNAFAVTATIDNEAQWAGGPYDAIFGMALDGLDYQIVTLQVDFGTGMGYVVQ
jgi:hypothetical protein